MWLLVILLLDAVPGFGSVTVLEQYATQDACQAERRRVGFEMAEAFPYERDFVIACQLCRSGCGEVKI